VLCCCSLACAAMKLSQEKQQWDHARSDWEHWRSRVQDEMETAQVGGDLSALQAASSLCVNTFAGQLCQFLSPQQTCLHWAGAQDVLRL
jgi:hypothetical protein